MIYLYKNNVTILKSKLRIVVSRKKKSIYLRIVDKNKICGWKSTVKIRLQFLTFSYCLMSHESWCLQLTRVDKLSIIRFPLLKVSWVWCDINGTKLNTPTLRIGYIDTCRNLSGWNYRSSEPNRTSKSPHLLTWNCVNERLVKSLDSLITTKIYLPSDT